jgi:hypothetical protein
MRRLSRCACAMTLEMPEIDSKSQSALHLCFYLLNAFYFPVILFSRCMSATVDLSLNYEAFILAACKNH